MKIKSNINAGIDTVPLPEMPKFRTFSALRICTWPTPE